MSTWNKYLEKIKDINICPFNNNIVCNRAGILRRLGMSKYNNDFEKTIFEDSLLDEPIIMACHSCTYYIQWLCIREAKKFGKNL